MASLMHSAAGAWLCLGTLLAAFLGFAWTLARLYRHVPPPDSICAELETPTLVLDRQPAACLKRAAGSRTCAAALCPHVKAGSGLPTVMSIPWPHLGPQVPNGLSSGSSSKLAKSPHGAAMPGFARSWLTCTGPCFSPVPSCHRQAQWRPPSLCPDSPSAHHMRCPAVRILLHAPLGMTQPGESSQAGPCVAVRPLCRPGTGMSALSENVLRVLGTVLSTRGSPCPHRVLSLLV